MGQRKYKKKVKGIAMQQEAVLRHKEQSDTW